MIQVRVIILAILSLMYRGNSHGVCHPDSEHQILNEITREHELQPPILKRVVNDTITIVYPRISHLIEPIASGTISADRMRNIFSEFHEALTAKSDWYAQAIHSGDKAFFQSLVDNDTVPPIRIIGLIGINQLAPEELNAFVIRSLQSPPHDSQDPAASIVYLNYMHLLRPWIIDPATAAASAARLASLVADRAINTADLNVVMGMAGPDFLRQIVDILTRQMDPQNEMDSASYVRDATLAYFVLVRHDVDILKAGEKEYLEKILCSAGQFCGVFSILCAANSEAPTEVIFPVVAAALGSPVLSPYHDALVDSAIIDLWRLRSDVWRKIESLPPQSIEKEYLERMRDLGLFLD